jgi:uncharacterized lipoprotein YmbA
MNISKTIVYGLLGIGIVMGPGFVKLWHDKVDIKTYMIEVDRDAPVAENPFADQLWIDKVTVLPPYNVRNLVLRKSDVEYTMSYYTELLMSPAENFRNEFFVWLSASGMFKNVSIESKSGMSHRLVVTVMEFYGDTEHLTATLNIKATLLDERAKSLNVLLSKEYRKTVDVPDATADALVRGFNKALRQTLEECEKDMAKAF